MEWKTFLNAIKKSKLASGTRSQILVLLFKNAGYIHLKEDGISDETARKWIQGDRNCTVLSYFPDGELTCPEGVYKFLKNRPLNRLKELQEIFCNEKDDSSPIDCTTEDMEIFCWSLVNQFLDLLGLQRMDMPAKDTSPNIEIIFDTVENETSENEISEDKINENVIGEQSLTTYKEETLLQEEAQVAQIAIPENCRICLCCQNWNGNVQAAYKNIDEEYGECKAFGKEVLAINGIDCAKFKENYSRATNYRLFKRAGILEWYGKL